MVQRNIAVKITCISDSVTPSTQQKNIKLDFKINRNQNQKKLK